jgi:trk system potassium uptake protein TrkA
LKLFESNRNADYTIIVGCGRLGASLANTLSNKGENVLVIDKTNDSFRRLAASYGGLTVIGCGTEFDKLLEAQIDRASAVISVTNDDNTNIMVALIVREIFNVKKVIARLHDPECEIVYQELGIETICPAVLSAKEIDKLLENYPDKEKIS